MKLHTVIQESAACRKLREAEFFLELMRQHQDKYESRYFLSAFLCALFSCTECRKLYSRDPRFAVWYQEVKASHIQHPVLVRLRKLRNKEVHQVPKETLYKVGLSFPEGIEMTSGAFVEVDFRSSSGPVGRYRRGESHPVEVHPVENRWVWDAPGEPDVMDLCRKGLEMVRDLIQSWDNLEVRKRVA